jgi:hypothetical protein
MNYAVLTPAEKIALKRVSAGSAVDSNMWVDLHRKGMVTGREGGHGLTEKGRTELRLLR